MKYSIMFALAFLFMLAVLGVGLYRCGDTDGPARALVSLGYRQVYIGGITLSGGRDSVCHSFTAEKDGRNVKGAVCCDFFGYCSERF